MNGTINRGRLEILSASLLNQCVEAVQTALTNCQLSPSDIDEVILAGGGSRIPKLKVLLSELFDGKEPLSSILPEEVFAVGAAVQAALIFDTEQADESYAVTSVPSLASDIVISGANDTSIVLLPKQTPLPARVSRKFENVTVSSVVVNLAEKQASAKEQTPVAKLVLPSVTNNSVTLDVDIGAEGEMRAVLSSGSEKVSVTVARK